jgi:radial spoke head protein 1
VEGDWIFPNGTFFRGKFKGNKPDGQGEWIFPNGNKVKGDFTQIPPEDETLPIKLTWATNPEIVDYTKI